MRLYPATAYDFLRPVDSHWEATAPPLARALPPLRSGVSVDAAIIGAGYTGLHAACRLTRHHGMHVLVLEAAAPGWGASGRNAGFCCIGSAKLPYAVMLRRYGEAATREFFAAQLDAVAHVANFIATHAIDAERSGNGEFELAHRGWAMAALKAEHELLAAAFGFRTELLNNEQLGERGIAGPEFRGGLWSPVGFGLHPLRYLRALAGLAIDAGAVIHSQSAVTAWRQVRGGHVLSTAGGEVRAKRVLLATNAYSDEAVPRWIGGRLLPALSRMLITRPLTADERLAQGWTSFDLAYDTRSLLHYFRLLPDGRFLFGGRGGTDLSPAGLERALETLRARFERMFPVFAHAEIERSWSGLVCLAMRRVPYIGPIGRMAGGYAALAYHGNGVAFGSYAGRLIADVMAGVDGAARRIPRIAAGPLRRFPLPRLRPIYLKAAYSGLSLRDERP
jgi:glycine/D-amino acid oxidase-like deaminating enzyme